MCSVRLTPGARSVLSCSEDRTAAETPLLTNDGDGDRPSQTVVLRGHSSGVKQIIIPSAAGGRGCVTVGDDGTIRVWDLARAEEAREVFQDTGRPVTAAAWLRGHPPPQDGGASAFFLVVCSQLT